MLSALNLMATAQPSQQRSSTASVSFGPLSIRKVPTFAHTVNVADVNNDGLNDLSIGTGYYLFEYAQNGFGSLNEPTMYRFGTVTCMDVNDLNGDGLPDIVVGGATSGESWNEDVDSIKVFFQTDTKNLRKGKTLYSSKGVAGVATGDFNNDGLNDIITGHWASDTIRVFYQRPYGRFDSSIVIPAHHTLAASASLVAGDFNSDGLLDVIQNSSSSWTGISFLAQQQDGSLQYAGSYQSQYPLGQLVAGDFNHDGRMDVAGSYPYNYPIAAIYVFLQDSSGQILNTPTIYPTFHIPYQIQAGDFDSDGLTDLAVIHAGWERISIYRQNTGGAFDAPLAMNTPYINIVPGGLAVGDINNDGRSDLSIVDAGGWGLMMYLNQSTQAIARKSVVNGSLESSRIDRRIPIVGSKHAGSSTKFASFSSSSRFVEQSTLSPVVPDIYDVNGQKMNRSAHRNSDPQHAETMTSKYPKISLNDAKETDNLGAQIQSVLADTIQFVYDSVRFGMAAPNCVSITDLNNDGRNDIVITINTPHEASNHPFFIYYQDSLGKTIGPTEYGKALMVTSMVAGDLNNDNLSDLILADRGRVRIIYQSPSGVLSEGAIQNVDAGIQGVNMGDLNSDGLTDIVLSYILKPYMRVYYQGPSGVFDSTRTFATNKLIDNYSDYAVEVGDVNGDGRMDIAAPLSFNSPGSYIVVFPQDNLGKFPEIPLFYEALEIPDVMEAGDFDLDGKSDLVVRTKWYPYFTVYHQNVMGGFDRLNKYGASSGNSSPTGIAVGDLNHDGKPDLAYVAPSGGFVTMINRTRTITDVFESHTTPSEFTLLQNYPNPFNPTTSISYTVPHQADVHLEIFDLLGKNILTVVNQTQQAGQYTVPVNMNHLSSGIYIYRLRVGEQKFTRKMVFVK